MAKSQKRSGREPKKPKKSKLKGSSPATALPPCSRDGPPR